MAKPLKPTLLGQNISEYEFINIFINILNCYGIQYLCSLLRTLKEGKDELSILNSILKEVDSSTYSVLYELYIKNDPLFFNTKNQIIIYPPYSFNKLKKEITKYINNPKRDIYNQETMNKLIEKTAKKN